MIEDYSINMNSNSYMNEIVIDDDNQHFRRINTDWFQKTHQPVVPQLYEQTVTATTTTTINKELNSLIDEMSTTRLEKSPMRRVNVVKGPQSAFARLFPDRYRREQEECARKHRSKSSDDRRYNFDRIISENDCTIEAVSKPRRVLFRNDHNHNNLNLRTKSEPYINDNLSHLPLNYDPDPEIIYRDNPDKIVYVQKVGVRYLRPPTPPPPEPIIIREVQSTPPQAPPPLVISSSLPVTPRTPSPIIVREQPPIPPLHQPKKVITKTLPPPPTPARRVIIKRVPPLPAKPRPVIIEKWLPYKTPPQRPIVYERAEQSHQTRPTQRNVILQYEPAQVRVEQAIQNVGCFRVDPEMYRAQFGSSLRRTDSIRKVLTDIGCNPDILSSTGYSTNYSSNQYNNSTHYDYSQKSRTCFTDEQLSELIQPSTKSNHHYDVSTSRNMNQAYRTTIVSNS